jgi:hypothetical protein
MKTTGKILVIAGLFLIAGSASLYAQRGMRWRNDSITVMRRGRDVQPKQLPDSLWRGHRPGFGPGYGWNVPGWRGMPFYEVPRNFGPGRFYFPWGIPYYDPFYFHGWGKRHPVPPAIKPERPAKPFIERIPNLTEKQKKEIDALQEKFRNEIQKFREENKKKIEEMRKSHQDKIKELLTPEQKKWFEERVPAPPVTGKKI